MSKSNSFIKQNAIIIFFVLTFVITWGCMALMAAPAGFPLTKAQMETMGPMIYIGMFIGPSAAGLIMTALVEGKAGFQKLKAELFKVRVGPRWYALAFLATPILAMLLLAILSLFSPEFVPYLFAAEDKSSLLLTGVMVGLAVGIFEEIGWTGFIIPQMRKRYSVLTTGIIVGVLWGAWHFLPFWEMDSFSKAFPFFLLIVRLFAWLPPYRALMVWVYEHTHSLFIVIIMHASLDFAMLTLPSMELSGSALVTWILVWSAALWLVIAAVLKGKSKT